MTAESILSSCVALLILLAIMGAIFTLVSFIRAKKQQRYFEELHKDLRRGQNVTFGGGMFGKLVRIGNNTCDIEVKSGAVIEVSRYAIQSIEK